MTPRLADALLEQLSVIEHNQTQTQVALHGGKPRYKTAESSYSPRSLVKWEPTPEEEAIFQRFKHGDK